MVFLLLLLFLHSLLQPILYNLFLADIIDF